LDDDKAHHYQHNQHFIKPMDIKAVCPPPQPVTKDLGKDQDKNYLIQGRRGEAKDQKNWSTKERTIKNRHFEETKDT
jgi:hypothetical protein